MTKKATYDVETAAAQVLPPIKAVEEEYEEEEEEDANARDTWAGKLDFLFSCLSYAVGLGNVWRFPYLCYENGGGAFLIPYTVSLLVAGLPIFFMELAFGQYASLGPVTIWKVAPLFQGTGYAMVVVSFLLGMYYNVLNGYSFFYMFHSFHWELPWSTCGNDWNSAACSLSSNNCTAMNGTIYNGTCVTADDVGDDVFATLGKPKSPSEEYFHNYMLQLPGDIHDTGNVQWKLALCLLLAWIILYLCMWRGIKASGKATYFTALFPYFVLTVLLVRGVTLPGSGNGLMFYLYPKWEYLLTAKVWGDAAVQIFFDLSPCWGGLIALASYNKFHNNCLRDALVVSFGNCLTSVYAGFAIFSLVGYMAYELGVDVENVVAKGPGLAFIAYPAGLARLPGAPIFAVLFFMMLLSLGLGTQFTIVETVVTAVTDEYPKLFRKRKWLILGIVCIISYLVGLVFCTNTGMYVLNIFDNYAVTWSVLVIGIVETTVISWVYGADRFLENIAHMLGYDPWPRLFWKIIWKWACPILLTVILIFTLYDFDTLKYGEYDYPSWADGIGWVLSVISILFIPLIAVIAICKEEGSLLTRLRVLIKPRSDWGPALARHKLEGRAYELSGGDPRQVEPGTEMPLTVTSKTADAEKPPLPSNGAVA